jgi:hypothetical protein
MERMKNPKTLYSDQSGLVYAICALAAPFYFTEDTGASGSTIQDNMQFFAAGKGWAEAARQRVFSDSARPGIESLMTEVLLHEHYLRTGDYAKGFMISGHVARHLQVLQLNIECDSDVLS